MRDRKDCARDQMCALCYDYQRLDVTQERRRDAAVRSPLTKCESVGRWGEDAEEDATVFVEEGQGVSEWDAPVAATARPRLDRASMGDWMLQPLAQVERRETVRARVGRERDREREKVGVCVLMHALHSGQGRIVCSPQSDACRLSSGGKKHRAVGCGGG